MFPVTSPFGDPSLTSDQDGASQPQSFLNDPEDRLLPGEADEHDLAAEFLDNSGELTDALADAGQEAGADGKAFIAEESLIQRTSADEPGAIQRPRPAVLSSAPIPTPYLEQRDIAAFPPRPRYRSIRSFRGNQRRDSGCPPGTSRG